MLKNVGTPNCIFCGTPYQYVTDGHYEIPHLYSIPATQYIGGKYVLDASSVNVSTIFCPNCGNMQFFSALVQGQVDKEGNAL